MKELVQSEMSELQSKLDLLEAENVQLKFDLEEVDKERTDLADEFRELERDNRWTHLQSFYTFSLKGR